MSSATTFAAPIERPGLDLRSVDPSCAKTRENNGKFRFGSKDAARGVFSVRNLGGRKELFEGALECHLSRGSHVRNEQSRGKKGAFHGGSLAP